MGPRVTLAVEVLTEGAAAALRQAAGQLLQDITPTDPSPRIAALQGQVWPQLGVESEWPTEPIELRLLTLDRLGMEPGKSGSRVLIGYFQWPQDPSGVPRRSSRPMVIKVMSRGAEDAMSHEFAAGRRFGAKIYDFRERFALPLHVYATDGYDVLWAPFAGASDEELQGADRDFGPLRVPDLSQIMSGASSHVSRTSESILREVFSLLRQAHTVRGSSDTPALDAFKWYLRAYDTGQWFAPWGARWGDGPLVNDLGAEYVNPVHLMRELRRRSLRVSTGFIHGDLHPRNVVVVGRPGIDRDESASERLWAPHIIDFGWATDRGPIAADFVLMECNLRFMLLPAVTPADQVKQLSEWLLPTDVAPSSPGLQGTVAQIQAIRQAAHDALFDGSPRGTSTRDAWMREYCVPLFLVAFGLLKHADYAYNTSSAILTVLKTGQHLARWLETK